MTRRMLNNPCPCVACRHRREARHHARGRVAWIGLLGLLACSVPLAAALPGDDPGAMPVPASPVTMTVPREPVLVPGTVRVTGEDGGAIIRWRESEPGGSPNGGRLVNGVRLPASGTGYYTYGAGALGIGDLARPGGGSIDGHASHQNGLDVDIRLPRRDRARGPANPSNYDRALTQAVVDRLVQRGASLVLIGPSLNLRGPSGVVVRWPNHDDHLHVRFPG